MKKILIFIVFCFCFNLNVVADQTGKQLEYGLQITGLYDYNEPEFMHNKSELKDQPLNNFGIVYKFTNSFLLNNYLTEFELDADYRSIRYDYWSNSTGTDNDIQNEVFNLRSLYGIQLTDKLMLKSGLGYRYLVDKHGDNSSSTGASGYDRYQEYRYIPILAELKAPIGSLNGLLKLEYDQIFWGLNESKLSSGYLKFTNNDGYMIKSSYQIPYKGFYLEPYYEFQSVEESEVVGSSQEPSNTTDEFGLKFTKKIGETELKTISNAQRVSYLSDSYYVGVAVLNTEVENGFRDLTGTAVSEEKDWGQKYFIGTKLIDNLDLEFAFNKFGESIMHCNNGDTVVTDGRYNNKANDDGDTLTCSANNVSVNIHSNSVSFALKPTINVQVSENFNFNVTGILGVTKWDQSETTLTAGSSTSMVDHSGNDLYYGLGIKSEQENLTFSLIYEDYDMFYDAEAIGGSISYNF